MVLVNDCRSEVSPVNIFEADKRILDFFGEQRVFDRNHKLEFCQTSFLTVGYPGFQKKERFCDKLIFKTRAKVNVHRLRFWLRLILVVTTVL